MNRAITVRDTAIAKNITGRRAYIVKKLQQKGVRYATKAERVVFTTMCRFYRIADCAFEAAKQLGRTG